MCYCSGVLKSGFLLAGAEAEAGDTKGIWKWTDGAFHRFWVCPEMDEWGEFVSDAGALLSLQSNRLMTSIQI